jgi:hypothetical protein
MRPDEIPYTLKQRTPRSAKILSRLRRFKSRDEENIKILLTSPIAKIDIL